MRTRTVPAILLMRTQFAIHNGQILLVLSVQPTNAKTDCDLITIKTRSSDGRLGRIDVDGFDEIRIASGIIANLWCKFQFLRKKRLPYTKRQQIIFPAAAESRQHP